MTTKSKIKRQTKAQRLSNPVWLRKQILELIAECDEDIEDDLEAAKRTSGDVSAYNASVQTYRLLKKHLERILAGKTLDDAFAEFEMGEDAP